MPLCTECTHYRPAIPPSSRMSRAIGGDLSTRAADALAKVLDDELNLLDEEASAKHKFALRGESRWPVTPIMSAYCAFDEANGDARIAEMKNAGGRCADYRSGLVSQPCSSCAHRVPAPGVGQRDHDLRQLDGRLSHAILFGGPTGDADSATSKRRDVAEATESNEIRTLCASEGWSFTAPQFFDTCAALSTADAFVACCFVNAHARCDLWAPA